MRFAHALLKPINASTTILLAVFTMLWGAWLLGTWSVFGAAHTFDGMREIAPEWAWGITAVVVGVAVLYGALRPSYGSLMRGTAASGAFWLCIGLTLFLSDWRNTGGLTYTFIATYSWFAYLNIKVNHDAGHDWSDRE